MGRPADIATLERIYKRVAENPGCSQTYISRVLDLNIGNFSGRLASMERVDLLLSEDGRGRLFPHSRYGVLSTWLLESGVMPYKASGKIVLVLRNGKWVRFAVRESAAAAKRQATALNMRHAGIPPKRKRGRR